MPPGCFVSEENVLLDRWHRANNMLVVNQAHGNISPVWPAVILHEKRRAAAMTPPAYRDIRVVRQLDAFCQVTEQVLGAIGINDGPLDVVIMEQPECQERV